MRIIGILLAAVIGLVSCASEQLPKQQMADMPKPPPPPPPRVYIAPSTPTPAPPPKPVEKKVDASDVIVGAAAIGGAVWLGSKLFGGSDKGCHSCRSDGVLDDGDPGADFLLHVVRRCDKCNGTGYAR